MAGEVWDFLAMCRFWKVILAMWIWYCEFFRSGCMSTLELVLKSMKKLLAFFLDFSVGCPNIVCLHLLGVLWKFGTW